MEPVADWLSRDYSAVPLLERFIKSPGRPHGVVVSAEFRAAGGTRFEFNFIQTIRTPALTEADAPIDSPEVKHAWSQSLWMLEKVALFGRRGIAGTRFRTIYLSAGLIDLDARWSEMNLVYNEPGPLFFNRGPHVPEWVWVVGFCGIREVKGED